MLTLERFTAEGYEGLGVPLGTDAFVQRFVEDKCLAIIEDVEEWPKTVQWKKEPYQLQTLYGRLCFFFVRD